jgi:hypothetical protein
MSLWEAVRDKKETIEVIMAESIRDGFKNLVWIRDKNGRKYVCSADFLKKSIKTKEKISFEEEASYADVSTIVVTKRW